MSSTEVLRAVPGLSYRRLDHWRREGIIICTLEPRGSGTRARWHPATVDKLRAIVHVDQQLKRWTHGLSLDAIEEIWDTLSHEGSFHLDSITVTVPASARVDAHIPQGGTHE